jgi:uncharacterized protein YprB with RNaseH-like and TPR domain
MKFASFDLETATPIDPFSDIKISCAAVAIEDGDVNVWKGIPHMNKFACAMMVGDFLQMQKDGYTFLTWNGTAFDFRVLAQSSGMKTECAQLAMSHVDMMLLVTFRKGWRLSLQAALMGARLEGKLKEVTLSTGETIDDMSGLMAIELWQAGEYDAVLAYLREDVLQPLALARKIESQKMISWVSRKGRYQAVSVPKLTTVEETFLLPKPDTSWMTDPPTRESFIEWMKDA